MLKRFLLAVIGLTVLLTIGALFRDFMGMLAKGANPGTELKWQTIMLVTALAVVLRWLLGKAAQSEEFNSAQVQLLKTVSQVLYYAPILLPLLIMDQFAKDMLLVGINTTYAAATGMLVILIIARTKDILVAFDRLLAEIVA